MFTTTFTFSTLRSGDKLRLLVAETPGPDRPAQPATALLTAADETVNDLVTTLRSLASSRYTLLQRRVEARPGQRCDVRRYAGTVLADLLTGDPAVTVRHKDCHRDLRTLAHQVRLLPKAAQTAVVDLALHLLDGADDIPVRVTVHLEEQQDHWLLYANSVLASLDDDEILDLLDGDAGSDTLLMGLRERHEDLEDLVAHYFVWPEVNLDDLNAWVAEHRPHLREQADAGPVGEPGGPA